MALPFTDLTSNVDTREEDWVVSGDGFFDDLMETINAHLKAQWCDGKITGPDYSAVYIGALEKTLQVASDIFLKREIAEKEGLKLDAEILLIGAQQALAEEQKTLVAQQTQESAAKTALINAQKATEDEKKLLVIAQTLGFKVDGKQKLYAKNMESWAVYESVNKIAQSPNTIDFANMVALYNEINNELLGGAVIT